MKKSYKINKYKFGTQEIIGLAPGAISMAGGLVDANREMVSDTGNMLKYGGQGAQMGAQMGAAFSPLGSAIGAGVGLVGGATYGLIDANNQQKKAKKAQEVTDAVQYQYDNYGAQNPDRFQTNVYKKGGKIKGKYKNGGEIDYNINRAKELGYSPDETGHLPSVDYTNGMWLKSKKHPTAFMEFLQSTLNPELQNQQVVVNPEGYFGNEQLQYIPRKQRGGTVNNNMIEVEKGEIVADDANTTHIGKIPHSQGGDKLPVYPKGFKRDKKQPYAIEGGTVYSTQYNEGEREQIQKAMNKVKYPISKGTKNRNQKLLDHMASLEGTPDDYMVNGGTVRTASKGGLDRRLSAKYAIGGSIGRSPMNTYESRERNQYLQWNNNQQSPTNPIVEKQGGKFGGGSGTGTNTPVVGGQQTAGDPGFICKNGAYYTFDGEDHIVPITTVGINNVSENSPRVYVSNMNIHIENADDQNIMIATIDGRILYSGKQTIIPVSSNGIYIVKIGEVTTKVFVK